MELIATSRSGGNGLLALDPAEAKACSAAIRDHKPDWVLNAGAYTAVDKAESEPELAMAVNGGALRAFAEALLDAGGSLLQVSTDFVFNGQQGSPYRPEQSRDSLGTYGRTKAAGEEAVEAVLGGSGQGVILRISWVIGPAGKNLALTMLRRHRELNQIGVVEDQVGCPTSTARATGGAALERCGSSEFVRRGHSRGRAGPAIPCWIARRRAKRWICLRCTGGRRCGSCWRPWHELNRETAGPPLGC